MEVQEVKISELNHAVYNPRKINAEQKAHLHDSLAKFGFVDPIVVNRNGHVIVGGHQRVKVWGEMGNETVPVVFVELSEEDEKELNIRLNANGGEFDFDLLKEFFDENLLGDWGLDAEFPEIDLSLVEDEDQGGLPDEKDCYVQTGDVYQLGDHRLMCGDSTSREDVKTLMSGEKAQLIFTDPPYNIDYKSPDLASYNSGKYSSPDGSIFNDDKTDDECVDFYSRILKNLYDFSVDNVVLYWWYASSQYHNSYLAFEQTGWKISQTLIWLKESMVLAKSQDYHHCYEPCILGWKKKFPRFKNAHPNNLKDAFVTSGEYRDAMDLWYEKRDVTSEYIHPTQKPVKLAERALLKHSKKGFIVLDLFGGSGSTLIACEQSGRKARVMEMDRRYCQKIIERWETCTGRKAVKQ